MRPCVRVWREPSTLTSSARLTVEVGGMSAPRELGVGPDTVCSHFVPRERRAGRYRGYAGACMHDSTSQDLAPLGASWLCRD